MKKTILILLISMLMSSVTSCGSKHDGLLSSKTESTTQKEITNDDINEINSSIHQTESETNNTESLKNTIGEILSTDFKNIVSENPALTPSEIADKIVKNKVLSELSMAAIDVDEGLLNGFDNNEIKGFSQGCTFSPIIGSIPFVGYVFQLNEGTDVQAFMDNLKSFANLRWNVCVEADEMTCTNVGSTVFFLMSPKTIDG